MTLRLLFQTLGMLLPISLIAASQTPASTIDDLFAGLIDAKSPGAAVLVRQDGHTIFARGYGVTDLRTHRKIDPTTDFRLASFTKQFTALSIMLLVHDGKLRYDQTVADIFPAFPAYGRAITIRQLLTHTSGLPDYETVMDQLEKVKGPTWTPGHQIKDEEVLSLLEQQSQGQFAPGTNWSYSNSGYVLLGLIVAKVSGEPFPRFLHDRIFSPLRMTHTLAYVSGENTVPHRAYGHSKESGKLTETDQSATSATLGDGGVYSNLLDLTKWDDALQHHTLLSETDMAPALTPVKLANGSEPSWPTAAGEDNLDPGQHVSYGFGWFLSPYQSHPRMWHSGSTSGFRTVIERFTSDHLTTIILANRTDLDPAKLALQVASALLNFPR